MNLLGYDFISFLGEDSLLLSNWREGRAHIELVDQDTWISPWHVLVALREDVLIVLQEEGKLLADCRISLHANMSDQTWDVVVQVWSTTSQVNA